MVMNSKPGYQQHIDGTFKRVLIRSLNFGATPTLADLFSQEEQHSHKQGMAFILSNTLSMP